MGTSLEWPLRMPNLSGTTSRLCYVLHYIYYTCAACYILVNFESRSLYMQYDCSRAQHCICALSSGCSRSPYRVASATDTMRACDLNSPLKLFLTWTRSKNTARGRGSPLARRMYVHAG